MNAKKRQFEDGEVAVLPRRAPAKRGAHRLIILAIIVALVAGTSFLVWQEVGPHVLANSQYRIEPDQIRIAPPPPPWIRADVKSEVIRAARLDDSLSLADRDLTVRMAAAFAAHPWVSRVERVSKQFPSSLDVMVTYRKPAAMVEVQDGAGGLPVDAEGVLLPTEDFSPEDAQNYPRIGEIRTSPSGPAGTGWGDPCVAGAAHVASVLANDWKALDLFRIVPAERKPGRSGVEYTFALITRSGTKVQWGLSPAANARGELPAAEKIAQLKRYAAGNNGSLDDPEGRPHEIVISHSGALMSKPRPRVDPLPASGE